MRTLTAALVSLLALSSLLGSAGRLLPAASPAEARLGPAPLLDGGNGGDDDDDDGDEDDDDEDFRVVG
ncbi:hypothetical protein [Vitiosangium sp. GDMCC 1.1324]|uniref:hypothetical protein n=1 Tax=Vitiosangium sp. (strain GDMCC 1.1324) TaxID=2138576 RepID=UPI00130EF602|nr:hypothetical protein [Vitiosangium sp. GDMCC 1.1324]